MTRIDMKSWSTDYAICIGLQLINELIPQSVAFIQADSLFVPSRNFVSVSSFLSRFHFVKVCSRKALLWIANGSLISWSLTSASRDTECCWSRDRTRPWIRNPCCWVIPPYQTHSSRCPTVLFHSIQPHPFCTSWGCPHWCSSKGLCPSFTVNFGNCTCWKNTEKWRWLLFYFEKEAQRFSGMKGLVVRGFSVSYSAG